MTEKRVSVRLAAVGGKQVRAELEGVGDAGVKGFGRMSKEAELANARLAAFATRVKIAAAVAVAAAAAAGIAMIKSGLVAIDAQANLAQSLGTTTRSIQVLTFAGDLAGVSMDEITAATKKLTLKLSDAAGGTGTAVDALKRLHLTATDLQALPLDERIVAIQDALTKFVPPAERAAVASALFGDKAALAFSRIDSATLRQASQDITDFGVAVSDQDADQIRTAGDAIDRLGLVWLGLTNQLTVAVAPALETVANALANATRTGRHEFDLLCTNLGIEHRLAPPQHPQTNGMVERFNGRIEEVLQSHHFRSGEELETTLDRYVLLYNQQLPQSALGSKTPLQAMKHWHKLKPELFRKQPYHLPGCDT